jgi:hypothetical protein
MRGQTRDEVFRARTDLSVAHRLDICRTRSPFRFSFARRAPPLLVDGNQDYDNIIVTKHLVHIHTERIFGRSAEKISYGLKASINRLTVDHALERAK